MYNAWNHPSWRRCGFGGEVHSGTRQPVGRSDFSALASAARRGGAPAGRALRIEYCGGWPARSYSDLSKEVCRLNVQSLGNAQARVEADPLFATFDLPNIHGVKICFLGQLLLAHAGLGSEPPN